MASSATPQRCEIDSTNNFIKNITTECQDAIFSFDPKKDKENILQKHLSVLRTDTQYATDNKLPAGSATIVDLNGYKNKISDDKHEVDNIPRSDGNIEVGKYLKEKISFILQAATASIGQSDLNEYSLKNMSNSVYNCLYLANNNKVKKIAFPILGGRIFFKKLLLEQNITKNILYQALLKGAVDFLTDYSGGGLSIEKIFFCSNNKQTYDNVIKSDYYTSWVATTKLDTAQQNVNKQQVKNLINDDSNYLIYSITNEMFNNEWRKMFESSGGGGGTKNEINKQEFELFLKKMIEVTNENDFFQKAFNQFPKFLKGYNPRGKSNFYDEIYPSTIYNGGDNIASFSSIINYPPSGIFSIFKKDSETPLAIVNAANTEIFFGGGVSGLFKMAIGNIGKRLIDVQGAEIKKTFKAAVNAYIANPSAASSSTSTPPLHKLTSAPPNIPFADVLKGLEGQLTASGDTIVNFTTLGITSVKDNKFLYPPSESDVDKKKSLNSAEPPIDVMIEAFETAKNEGDRDFYLRACRSIKAAYDLDMSLAGSDDKIKMRAKLLLNLRKNSLLLKVPKGWDYAKMQPGKEVEPELTPPFSVPLQNESGVFCFENVGFQLLFSIDSVRKFSEKTLKEIDATTLCNSLSIETDRPKCNVVIVNTYDVLHKMSEQYKQDKLVAVEAEESKRKLEEIKNIEVTEVYTQDDGSNQADAADFLIMTILQYLKLYKPIYNSIYFKQYELTLCSNDIDNSNIDHLKAYKYDVTEYEQNVGSNKKTYSFSKNSVLKEIGINVDNKKLLDISNPVGIAETALMCFTNGNNIQECIDDYLSEKKLEINDDETSETGQYQEELMSNTGCKKEDTIKRSVLYIPETQKYLIVTLKRYTLNKGTTNIIKKKIDVSEKITINADETYGKKVEFKLRGVICKTGTAKGGHYVYISYENDKKILYNDYNPPTQFKGDEYDIDTTGYVFLYEKNTSVQAGGRNIIHTTTHSTTAPKSKHNSSFKVSSSKTKGKSHSRSHTQRVK
jgi:O-acetyl-ADP-ribose deacetylase (regulator of RNase III)